MPPDDLDLDALRRDLSTSVIGRSLACYERAGSTNDIAREHARAGHAEGLVVLAEEQSAGRGRLGRGWAAPPHTNLLLTLLLRPTWLPPADAFMLTMLAGVALCEAVEQITPVHAALKWPNDLMLPVAAATPALRKAAGILSELEIERDAISWALIGIGVNVNWAPSGLVDGRDLGQVATSVSAAAGRTFPRSALLWALLERLDARYLSLRQGRREELFGAWAARLTLLGQPVQVRLAQGELRGVAVGVEPSGALRVRDERGVVHVVLAGDVGG